VTGTHKHPHTHPHAGGEDNSHAGQGAVVLDIGGDVGALVVRAPSSLAGVELEARPVGWDGREHLEHVAVLARPVPGGGQVHSAVFGALPAGAYEVYVRPDGAVRLTVAVPGGAVADTVWP
jgi:hypothetical protein